MKRRYITYFDSNYAARALAMMESLLRRRGDARITALCHDELAAAMVSAEMPGCVEIVTGSAVDAREPRLDAARAGHAPWEFYALRKLVLIDWILEQSAADELVAYIDADTFFYSDPEPVFSGLDDASIAVSPHRFNEATAHLEIYGTFNAGFGIFRNDAAGRQCARDWIEDCFEWCYCLVGSGGRFMNQGYLNAWPARYPRVAVMAHPGANLAPWNAGSHRLESAAGRVTVDGAPLIFYHFSGVSRGADGRWQTPYTYEALKQPVVLRDVYRPYLEAVESATRRLVARFGKEGLGSVRAAEPGIPMLDLGAGSAG